MKVLLNDFGSYRQMMGIAMDDCNTTKYDGMGWAECDWLHRLGCWNMVLGDL